ncbi:flagellar basal body-associated protein FliL [Glaciecola sp. XM2]|uniref:flagellar basal body-associated FliL family protein n=1 Tax=Glaciecola sp. XM2 TaxID=1914931 RepID=UPI001BDE1C7C|nr:flagellar basal body-associated FliL family protein [Glaciecola sp. XM2]MBT1451896.1 flagellar basal body-associated protein FliL [Glaciecola sp. XM2]
MAILAISLLNSQIANAQDQAAAASSIAYIAIEPDIVTNYSGDNSERLGFLRITIEMMIDDTSLINDLEHHMPLLRATAIEVIGAQSEQKVRSLTGREEIRRMILKRFRDIMANEVGNETVKDIIFTKYLRQG